MQGYHSEAFVLLTTLGIFVTMRVNADIPLSSVVPAEAPASIRILALSALFVSAASCVDWEAYGKMIRIQEKRKITKNGHN